MADEMKIESLFITNIISRLLKSVIKKKLGCDAYLQLNSIKITYDESTKEVYAHLDMDASMKKEELAKLLTGAGS